MTIMGFGDVNVMNGKWIWEMGLIFGVKRVGPTVGSDSKTQNRISERGDGRHEG